MIKNYYKNKMLIFNVALLFWIAIAEGLINSYYNIADYNDFLVTLFNRMTWVHLVIIIHVIQTDKRKLLNFMFLSINLFFIGIWSYFYIWDIVDFIKNPNMGYWLFMISPPLIIMNCFYWVVLCLMGIFNTNNELQKCV